jgi:lipoprotein-releasing system ATP-binding protein
MSIELRQVEKTYHDANRELTIISQLSYTFPSDGAYAIVGRSGIGKSTLLHLLGALDTPTTGTITIDGTVVTALTEEARAKFRGEKIGFIFQFHHLLPEFTARENVAMPLIIHGISEDAAYARADEMLRRVGLGKRIEHRPGELSGGEQQRVAVARAIVVQPRCILADEPTGNLDVKTAREVQELLLEVQRDLKNLLVIVTHSEELARSMRTRLEMLPGGHLQDAAIS